jgi:hypothetical protein
MMDGMLSMTMSAREQWRLDERGSAAINGRLLRGLVPGEEINHALRRLLVEE